MDWLARAFNSSSADTDMLFAVGGYRVRPACWSYLEYRDTASRGPKQHTIRAYWLRHGDDVPPHVVRNRGDGCALARRHDQLVSRHCWEQLCDGAWLCDASKWSHSRRSSHSRTRTGGLDIELLRRTNCVHKPHNSVFCYSHSRANPGNTKQYDELFRSGRHSGRSFTRSTDSVVQRGISARKRE